LQTNTEEAAQGCAAEQEEMMVSDEALKKLQEQIAAWPMERRFVVQQLIRDYLRNREDLRAYEATGLTPEDITAAVSIPMSVKVTSAALGTTPDRLRELADADKDGRLAVLPCKVGDTLWVTGRDNVPREMELEAPDIRAVCTDEDNLCMSTCNRRPDGFCAYRLRNDGADVGKTVFLTREEAKKALEATKEGAEEAKRNEWFT
jgi:hypothetical protein